MSSVILYLLLGLGSGAVYALLASGLVLKFRSAGVVDFGHCAVATFIAYVYISLQSTGSLQLPWPLLPHSVALTSTGMATGVSIALSLVYAAVLGCILYVLIYRPLRAKSDLVRICASVGTMLYVEATAVLNFGTTSATTPPFLPNGSLVIGGIYVPEQVLWLAVIAVVAAAVLAAVYRFTAFGIATRAVQENEAGAGLIGLSANRISGGNWVIATVLAGAGGILIAPISSVDPTSYTLLIVPALAVALAGRFSSFAVTAAAGLALGMLQSEMTYVFSGVSWLPQQGVSDALPFVLIVVVMMVLSRGISARGSTGQQRNPSLGSPRSPVATTAIAFAVGLVALFVLQGAERFALISSFATVCVALSVVVLTGYAGQVTLMQMSFAGASAFVLTHVTSGLGVGFPVSLILASLAAVPLGILVGVPALRLRGVNLAVVTLAAATAMDALVFNSSGFTGGVSGTNVPAPTLFGWNLGISEGHDYPRVIYGVLVLVIVCLVGLLVARLRRSQLGRMMIAVRSNERAAAAAGINVRDTKLVAFALSAAIAGIGGCLYAYQAGNVSAPTFATFDSVTLVAIVYIGSVGRISGAVAAAILLSGTGLAATWLNIQFNIGQYQPVVAGILLTFTAVKQPDGIAANPPKFLVTAGRRLAALVTGSRAPSLSETAANRETNDESPPLVPASSKLRQD